uniref:UDP-glucose 4-epimerase n=1 Tax=Nephromyces sp. MMRI TaxID=2496275 RepID=A0A3S8V334_9APIC|nr:3-hydroxymethyl-3-methylglutaryl-CoA lyase [Nephromyces sp. MMRI]
MEKTPKVICTGGAGYIGSNTVVKFIEKGWDVIILDNFTFTTEKHLKSKFQQIFKKEIKLVNSDLRNYEDLKCVFKEHTPDIVVHFAGLKAIGESLSNPLEYYNNNVAGTLNLLRVMCEYNCKTFIFSSSAAVYTLKEKPIVEDDNVGPGNPYGRTKLMIEQILKDLYYSDKQWKISILRYFNPVGSHSSGLLGDASKNPTNLLPVIHLTAAKKRETLPIFGNDWDTHDGTGVRDFIHIEDLAEGHVCSAEHLISKDCEGGVCYTHNLGTGKGTSVLEMVNIFEEVSGVKIPIKHMPRREGDLGSVIANPQLAHKQLNWKAKRDIKDACVSAWKWHTMNVDGLY